MAIRWTISSAWRAGEDNDSLEGWTRTGWVTIVGFGFSIIGAVFATLALRHVARRRAFLRGSRAAMGVVVGFDERRDREEPGYFPIVRFTTESGREVKFLSEAGSSHPSSQVGDAVPIRYRPDVPERAEIDSFMGLWGLAIVFAALSGAFLCAGVGMLFGWIPI